jgi:long-chain acyl-CoA synthetase
MSVPHDVTELVTSAAQQRADKLAVVEAGGRGLTWEQLEDKVARTATGLGRQGVVAGQRVLIALGNRLEFIVAYLGVLRAQAVAVPVNPTSTEDELVRMVADSGSRLALADGATLPRVRAAVRRVLEARESGDEQQLDADLLERSVPTRVVALDEPAQADEIGFAELTADESRPVPPLPDPDKLAVLLYTSGTSGRPRAAMLSHRALLANLEQVGQVEPPMMHGDDVVLGVLPLFHVYGLNAVLGGVLWHRCKLVLVERFDPEAVLDIIEDEACSVIPVAPPAFAYWLPIERLRERLGPVRLMLSGSAPLSVELIEQFGEATDIPIHQGYGLTEASPVVTSTLCSVERKNGSVGAALPGIEIRLVDERGQTPDGGDPGEIVFKGQNLFSGYWPDGSGGVDDDGWWATGDVGFLDPDGDLFLVDRIKELIIVSGFNVYPTEVEDVIREVEGVSEAAVIGVPDDETGEAVVAYVRTEPGLEPDEVEAAVLSRCAERLARFKQPHRVEMVEELPLTVTGKVRKGTLRASERRRRLDLLS